MSKEETVVIVAAIIIAIFGVIIVLVWGGSTNAFSRSGSLIVCIGIMFGALDIRSIYEKQFEKNICNLEDKRLENDIVFSDSDLKKEIRGSTNYFISRAIALKKTDNKRVVFIDTLVLLSGTLIWGFGDLLF